MGFAIAKAIALSMSLFSIYIEAHPDPISPAPHHGGRQHRFPPSPSPTVTPKPKPYPYTHPPIYAPSPSPIFLFPRSYVIVKGFVYCKSCKHLHNKTLVVSTPLRGATVKLQCNNRRIPQAVNVTTAKNGSFDIKAPKTVTSYGAHKCRVFLVSPPSRSKCTKPSNLNGGVKGAILRPYDIFFINNAPIVQYNVGPFAFLTPKC